MLRVPGPGQTNTLRNGKRKKNQLPELYPKRFTKKTNDRHYFFTYNPDNENPKNKGRLINFTEKKLKKRKNLRFLKKLTN